jgi:ATP-binding cassette subfamily F protein 1
MSNIQTYFSENITIQINGKNLINESDLTINSDTKYFLVGNNGCGKTTLLNFIYEKLKDTTDILLIEQDIQIESEQNIYDFMLDANKDLHNKYVRYHSLEHLDNPTDEEFNEITQIQEYLNQHDWYSFIADAKKILNGLGFLEINNSVKLLSGGWQMRLALAKLLLRKPQILLLDEPTNHLDLDAVIWLTEYLSEYKNTVIIVSHQIEFINELSDVILYIGNPELQGNKLYKFKGNYESYLKGLELINKEVNNKYNKYMKQIEQLKKKSTPKKDVEEFIKKNNVIRPAKPYLVNINFPDVPIINSKNIIQFNNVDFNYLEKQILHDINISISMKSRFVLVGPNGSGKTTFFKLCSGYLKPKKGEIIKDDRVKIGWFNQQIIENLPLELTPIEYLKKIDNKLDDNKCRMYLSKLGLGKQENISDPCLTKINKLSGGQKTRIAFSAIQIQEPNIILMDEPTNHLDIESIEGLIKGINAYNGGILFITHDVHLIKSIKNISLYYLENSTIKFFNGDFDEYKNFLLNNNLE